ncbi:VWA domain-containing protein [Winogradskyella echinorum]|uniref:VWA domain-containing protein n=1 Tax=Winogradskyella echinorum TaxID=538189 RepID=A0ABR6Y3N7_9FLAO|nr:vWA domain-containing protein [Winogradskyella echinorum]MBC3847361.1 VWA domain-containing protein [Winogradskyella echinorum]MBC5751709.1 VWA domain-containing protein [Winogradskyella echinorum]
MKTQLNAFILTLCLTTVMACNANSKSNQQDLAIAETKIETKSKYDKPEIKVALLLDTSNSMDGLIDQAKAQLWQVVNELSYAKCKDESPNLKIALYEYGNNKLNADEGYLRQVIAFSDDLDEISKSLFSLTTDGGEEYCGKVISTALNQLQWGNDKDDLKLIFIAGNEPYTQGNVSYKTASKLAHQNDVTVNTIFCGDYNQGITSYWKDGADLTHGNYMAINHNQATVHVASPYDDKILELNEKLNRTYVAYGSTGRKKMEMQAEQDSNARSYNKANAVSRTVSKSSRLYKNSSWDLVDAEKEDDFSYDQLKEEQLPKELKGKSKAEIKSYVEKKRKERETLQKAIAELNIKRQGYIESKTKDSDNGLENALIKAIKAQAKQKNYKWEKS